MTEKKKYKRHTHSNGNQTYTQNFCCGSKITEEKKTSKKYGKNNSHSYRYVSHILLFVIRHNYGHNRRIKCNEMARKFEFHRQKQRTNTRTQTFTHAHASREFGHLKYSQHTRIGSRCDAIINSHWSGLLQDACIYWDQEKNVSTRALTHLLVHAV